LSRKYAEGRYKISTERIEKEIASLRTALNAAIDAYKHSSLNKAEINFHKNDGKDYSTFEDESLPKREGMGRRRDR